MRIRALRINWVQPVFSIPAARGEELSITGEILGRARARGVFAQVSAGGPVFGASTAVAALGIKPRLQ